MLPPYTTPPIIDSPFSGFMVFYYFTFSCLMTKRNLTV